MARRRPSPTPSVWGGWIVAAAAVLALAVGAETQLVINGEAVSTPAADNTRLTINGDTVSAVTPGQQQLVINGDTVSAVTPGQQQLVINGEAVSTPAVDNTRLTINGDTVSAVTPDQLSPAAAAPVELDGQLVINGQPVVLTPEVAGTPFTINGGEPEVAGKQDQVNMDTFLATGAGAAVNRTPSVSPNAAQAGRRPQQITINGKTVSLQAPTEQQEVQTVTVTSVICRTVTRHSLVRTPATEAAVPGSIMRTLRVPVGISGKSKVIVLKQSSPLVSRTVASGASVTFRPRPSVTLVRLPQTGEPGRVTLSVMGGQQTLPPIVRPISFDYLPPPTSDAGGQQQQRQGAGSADTFSFLAQPQDSLRGATSAYEGTKASHAGLDKETVYSTGTEVERLTPAENNGSPISGSVDRGALPQDGAGGSLTEGPQVSGGLSPADGAPSAGRRPWGALAAGGRLSRPASIRRPPPLPVLPLPLWPGGGASTGGGPAPLAYVAQPWPGSSGVSPVGVMLPPPVADGGSAAARRRPPLSSRASCPPCHLIGVV